MHYVCIENNTVISILNYQPNVPVTVTVQEISDEQANQIAIQTHYFDINSRSVIAVDSAITDQKNKDLANGQEREFLNSTDWKILRHLRQKALAVATTMTESEYLALEQQRQDAAARII
jgi:hypothetical protein